jgi:hypothetical protein
MDLEKRIKLLKETALGLGALGFSMMLLSFYVCASGMLGEKSSAASGWLFNMAVEFMGIATCIALYVAVYVAPAVKEDE